MKEQIPEAVFWCVAVGLLAVTVLLVRQRGITARLRRRTTELADDVRSREEEVRHLVAVRLPALADHGPQQPLAGVGLLDARLSGSGFAKSLDHVLERFATAVEHAQARADQSAKAALKSSMRSIQALANEQQVAISDMQDRHDRPDVLRDLLEIDHANAQFGRRAQAIAVLCGSWPGRQRSTSALIEVVRGATSRIRDYRRVQIHGQADIAVESRAVEPVVLTIAELLDNAARHSQPNTKVEVNVQSVHNGACVIIDDAGVGMDAHATERAAALLSGLHAVDVTRLDDPPQFGFAVIGVLAARYGFSVSADTRSPYGGVRAVVFLPSALLTHRDTAEELPPVTAPPARASSSRTLYCVGPYDRVRPYHRVHSRHRARPCARVGPYARIRPVRQYVRSGARAVLRLPLRLLRRRAGVRPVRGAAAARRDGGHGRHGDHGRWAAQAAAGGPRRRRSPPP